MKISQPYPAYEFCNSSRETTSVNRMQTDAVATSRDANLFHDNYLMEKLHASRNNVEMVGTLALQKAVNVE